jgi:hypothetical protein
MMKWNLSANQDQIPTKKKITKPAKTDNTGEPALIKLISFRIKYYFLGLGCLFGRPWAQRTP